MNTHTLDDLLKLQQWDTPTICNGLELIDSGRRDTGFTTKPFVCLCPDHAPVIGYARTAAIRAKNPSDHSDSKSVRMKYYEYVSNGDRPSIVIIQDLDDTPGVGAFWGEVNTNIHLGLGVAGCLTNGSMRDLTDAAPGFQLLAGSVGPSHAHVHVEDYGHEVSVHGLRAVDGNIIHMDQHGAVVIPPAAVTALPDAIEQISRKESIIITAARSSDFNYQKLRDAMLRADETS